MPPSTSSHNARGALEILSLPHLERQRKSGALSGGGFVQCIFSCLQSKRKKNKQTKKELMRRGVRIFFSSVSFSYRLNNIVRNN